MSKKFFYNKVYNPKKRRIITGIIIGVSVVCVGTIAFIIYKHNNRLYTCSNQIVKIKEQMNIEINSKFPDKKAYFNEIQCVNEKKIKVDTSNVDITKLGEYSATITIGNDNYNIKINVVDNTAPELKLKKVTINPGTEYTYNDFVESCVDNSKEDCKLDFYQGGTDEDGNNIKYDNYKQIGNYEVKIIASDSSGNQSIVAGNLEIAEKTDVVEPGPQPDPTPDPEPEPTPEPSCEYGNLEYDSNYVLTTTAGVNNCAISKDAIQKDSVKEYILKVADTETSKIQDQVNQIGGLSGMLTVSRNITAIPNKENKGYVGYSLYIKITDGNNNTIVSYYLKEDSSRVYDSNPYNIK